MKKNPGYRSSFLFLFCVISVLPVFSQLNQWTWIKGDTTTNPQGSYGQANVPATTNNPKCTSGAAYWKDHEGNFWLFSGFSYSLVQNGFWKYNPATNMWTHIVPEDFVLPPGRNYPAFWTDNNGNFWLYGGLGWNNSTNTYGYLNDLWKYNVTTHLWTLVNGSTTQFNQVGNYGVQGLATNANKPHSRRLPTTWTDNSNNLWMFGGTFDWVGGVPTGVPIGWLNDLWKYDINSNMWTWMKGDSTITDTGYYGTRYLPSPMNKPGSRSGSLGWKDQSDNLWLYGGYGGLTGSSANDDIWKYDITTNNWTWIGGDSAYIMYNVVYGTTGVSSPGNKSGFLYQAFTWNDNEGNFWMFGGDGDTDHDYGILGDMWKYNPVTYEWTHMKGNRQTNNFPVYGQQNVTEATNDAGARDQCAGWTDELGNLYIFGGRTVPPPNSQAGYFYNDLWKLTLAIPVPVKLFSFTGQLQNEIVFLNWKTEQETNLDHYEIERSFNGIYFEKILEVKATNIKEYNTTDNVSKVEEDIIYYRLRMVDIDGKFSYSNIIKIHVPLDVRFSIYPNPANNYTTLKFNKNLTGKVNVQITDATGKIILKNYYDLENGEVLISTGMFTQGTYPVTIVYMGERFVQNLAIIR